MVLNLIKNMTLYMRLTTQICPQIYKKLIENEESGLVLLRLVQILGQDNFEDLGSETLLFIVSALNQLNIDKLRNKILLKSSTFKSLKIVIK